MQEARAQHKVQVYLQYMLQAVCVTSVCNVNSLQVEQALPNLV